MHALLKQWRIRLLHWEYWSFNTIYAPIYFYWFWLSLRARSFFFFNTSNPGINYGGFLMESKKGIYDLLPKGTYPTTIFCKAGEDVANVTAKLSTLTYPLIAKPDIGLRGMAVALLHNWEEVLAYHAASRVDYLFQQYIAYQQEVGIFYYRYPNQPMGVITGIVYKEFLTVKGDGHSTILQLLLQNDRYVLQIEALQALYAQTLQNVLPAGKEKLLVPFGNHCRGTRFIDLSHQNNESLTTVINNICTNVKGFYFGRLDIKYHNWEDLCQGKNFSIIELNGAGSEPAHIYDSKHSIWFGWKEIMRHWKILYNISVFNKKKFNLPYLTTSEGLEMLRQNSRQVKLLSE